VYRSITTSTAPTMFAVAVRLRHVTTAARVYHFLVIITILVIISPCVLESLYRSPAALADSLRTLPADCSLSIQCSTVWTESFYLSYAVCPDFALARETRHVAMQRNKKNCQKEMERQVIETWTFRRQLMI
jgi:hypothetical protein